MTTRTARRAAVLEVKPDAPSASPVVVRQVRVAPPRRGDRDAATPWTFELNAHEREMLAERLTPLTDREREVVYAVCAGGQNPAIAERMFIALPTLRTHLMRINQKLGLRSKSETIRFVLACLLESYRAGGGGAQSESRDAQGAGPAQPGSAGESGGS